MELTNQGRFPFSFSIVNYKKLLESHQKGDRKKGNKSAKNSDKKEKSDKGTSKKSEKGKGSKATTEKSDKKKVARLTKIDVGGFGILPSSGMVEPNEKCVIDIELIPNESKEYKEEILIDIPEMDNTQKKTIVKLQAVACEPKLDFGDFENIFMDHFIVESVDDFEPPRNIEGCSIFSRSDTSLYFKLVCINTSFTTKLYFKNTGYVVAQLTAKVEDSSNVFQVTPQTIAIDPYSSSFLELSFKPNAIQQANGSLELSYNATSSANKMVIQLYGKACLPQVKLSKPVGQNGDVTLDYGPLCIGYSKQEKIAFQNVGLIKCKVIVEVSPYIRSLTIAPTSDTLKLLNVQDEEDISDMSPDIMVNLRSNEIAEFDVIYKPTNPEKLQVVLNLHIVHNPFETNKILINLECFDKDVVFEKLEPIRIAPQESSNSSITSIGYALNMGYKQLNKLYKESFCIRNRSQTEIYKFRLQCAAVQFIPEVGHLKPNAFKEILVVFKATSPVVFDKEEITCNLDRIQYVTPDNTALSWDDRQKLVYWTTEDNYSSEEESLTSSFFDQDKMEKSTTSNTTENDMIMGTRTRVVAEGTEPKIITSVESCEMIPLYLTLSADYCRYECGTKNIEFPDTYVKEEAIEEFLVSNTGNIPLGITWNLLNTNNDESLNTSKSEGNSELEVANFKDVSLKSASSSSLVSSLSSSYLRHKSSPLPFVIIPGKAVIDPNQSMAFNIRFHPQLENNYEALLESNIEALDPNLEQISIGLDGNALPVPFYLELDDGSSTSKDITMNFETIGVATESTRKVLLVNPNEDSITFQITPRDKGEFSYFTCEASKGTVNKRKKCPISFSFRPAILGSFKDHYDLQIYEKTVKLSIVLQGHCREPKVYFSGNNIQLKPTVANVKVTQSVSLINDDSIAISFKFLKKSLISGSQQDKLEVFPVVGRLKPGSSTEIKITFTTLNVGIINFNVKCCIEKYKLPLNLHVTTKCVKVQPIVNCMDNRGEIIHLQEDKVNAIDLGRTYKGRRDTISFDISNNGETGLFYSWELDNKSVEHLFKISIDNEKGFLKIGDSIEAQLVIEAVRAGTLRDFKIVLKILYGPAYIVHIKAISEKPIYTFSFTSYNFGCCLIQNGITHYYSTQLGFKNLDSKTILVENHFENSDSLTVDFTSKMICPNEIVNIPIHFHPQQSGSYKTEVQFLLGGIRKSVYISGEAARINLELCNAKDKFIDFGQILVNTDKMYRVNVYNNSCAKVNVLFGLHENLAPAQSKPEKLQSNLMEIPVIPSPVKDSAKRKDDKKDKKEKNKSKPDKKSDKVKNKKELEIEAQELAAKELLKQQELERQNYLKSFTIVPNMYIDIPSKGKSFVDIIVRPNHKMEFEEKLFYKVQDCIEPLCVIKGSSIIPEFSFNKKDVAFRGVITGCIGVQFITLKNTGDVSGSFTWKIEDKRNLFTIEPKTGFVLPKNEIQFKILFVPKYEKCQFKVKAKCSIKEMEKPLEIVLKGNCIKLPEPLDTIMLRCNVRERSQASVEISNNTSEEWILQCEVPHEAFSASSPVIVPPYSSTPLVITYSPKRMTLETPDECKLLIKIPDGSGMVYNIIGNADPPTAQQRFEKEVPCKQNFWQTIPIKNWLTSKQTLEVSTEVTSPKTVKTLYNVFGFKNIELNGMEAKQYKWGVYVVNEGVIEFKVTFKNPESGEYEYFELSLKANSSEPVDIIEIQTRVREAVTKQIKLENPLNVPITYAVDSNERALNFPKLVMLEPYTLTKIDVTYTPVYEETKSIDLVAKCEELGSYTFLINLHAASPRLENILSFTAELGAKVSKGIPFRNVFDRTIEFSYQCENEQFTLERCNPIAAGDSSKIVLAFEPSMLGHMESTLTLTSPVAGEYIYPLVGECVAPTPKGPFQVRSNFPTVIDFKNPFDEDKPFEYRLSPDLFYSDFNENIIKSRKSARFQIFVRPPSQSQSPITGKLIIYAVDMPDVQWTYYLQFNSYS